MDSPPIPDERPQRRREYSGPGSTLGLAALVIVLVGVAIWWFELRGEGSDVGGSGAGYGIVETPAALNSSGKQPVAEEGRVAPNFRLARLDGSDLHLTDFRGQYVLVNFWATWCGPCRAEAPAFQRFADASPQLTVLGVNQQEDAGAVRSFTGEFKTTYPVVLDRTGEVSLAYRIGLGIPVTFLVGPDGVIQHIYGGEVKQKALDQLRACLTGPASGLAACIRSDS